MNEVEDSKQQREDREQDNNADATSYALKLPSLVRWVNQDTQTWFMDMRIVWYGKPPFSRKTHIRVWLKTHKYIIVDHYLFTLWDKITSRSLYRDRIFRVKDLNK